jgi:hypothetical protein
MPVQEEWLKQDRELPHRWRGLTRLRYNLLSDSVKAMFESGNLSPRLVQAGVELPDILMVEKDTQNRKTLVAIADMESDLKAIKSVCTKEGTDLMVISLPSGTFVTPLAAAEIRKTGFLATDELFSRRTIDSLYESFADHIGAPFLEFTKLFR